MANDNKTSFIALVCALFALIIALVSLLPISYNELEDLPDLFEIEDIPNIDLAHGLCLWLPFDGVALDKSGFRNDGILYGNTSYISGIFDSTIYLDGITDYVYVFNNASLQFENEISFSFWFNCSNYNASKTGGRNSILNLLYSVRCWLSSSSELVFEVRSGLNYYVTNCSYTVGLPFFVYGSYNSSIIALWLNGVLVDSDIASGSVGAYWSENYIGYGNVANREFNGFVDDVRIYNRVLNEYEILTLYELGV